MLVLLISKNTEVHSLLNHVCGEPLCEIGEELEDFFVCVFGNVDLLVTSVMTQINGNEFSLVM